MSRRDQDRQSASRRKPQSRQTRKWSTNKKLLVGLGAAAIIFLIVIIATLPAKPKPYSASPLMTIDTSKEYIATIETEKGNLVLKLFASDVAITVNNFVFLARDGFYNGTTFHRVVREPSPFVVQGGCPICDGTGNPGYQFADEITEHTHVTGALSMANSGPNTNGCQFFITLAPQHHLDGKHTAFGQLIGGMDVLDSIEQGDVMIRIRIEER